MSITRHIITEHQVPGKPLGRHVTHDDRSRAYAVTPSSVVLAQLWKRDAPILDQDKPRPLGSCCGNAMTGAAASDPLWRVITTAVPSFRFDEAAAVALYSAATKLDNVAGTYPPDDTGSSGLAVAKAAQQAGLISGYTHCFSLDACKTAIQTGPFITGVSWYDSFDQPDSSGRVSISPGAQVRGGHEVVVRGWQDGVWLLDNSWGTGWGDRGSFSMTDDTYARLLADQGDATVPVPLTAPAPQPTPAPQPGDTVTKTFTRAAWDEMITWANKPRHYGKTCPSVAADIRSGV